MEAKFPFPDFNRNKLNYLDYQNNNFLKKRQLNKSMNQYKVMNEFFQKNMLKSKCIL